MNKTRRSELQKLVLDRLESTVEPMLNDILTDLEALKDEEQEAFDNLTEGLQEADSGQRIQEAAEALQEAYDNLDGLADTIDEIKEKVQEAME